MPGSRTTLPHSALTLLLTAPLSCNPDPPDGQVTDPHGCRTIILPAPCGDGITDADEGEECDDGPHNADYAPCTSECKLAACGDGLLRLGVEECDNGPQNADNAPCTSQCTLDRCGDGVTNPDTEECDLGDENADDADCTSACTSFRCGDGLTHHDTEECDDGPDNRPEGPCTDTCKIHPCGDGALDPPEECDDGNRIPGDGCDPTCTIERHTVFLTSTSFTGALPPIGGRQRTGLDLADAHCQAAADSVDLPGTYRAWLSLEGEGPLSRFAFPADFPGHFVRIDGATIAEGWPDLLDSQLALPIAIDETGATRDNALVWTNTEWDGSPILPDPCFGWTSASSSVSAPRGRSGYGGSFWSNAGDSDCSIQAGLYCFQVTQNSPPP